MDKYQEKILEKVKFQLVSEKGNGSAKIENGCLVITQNEDYNIEKYMLVVITNVISSIELDNKLVKFVKNAKEIRTEINFKEPYKNLNIKFVSDMADEINLKVEYVCADKSKYDQKVSDDRRKLLLQNLNFSFESYENLINVYWEKSSKEVETTEIELFCNKGDKKQFMARYKYDNNLCYHAFNDLVPGDYWVKLTQYDKDGKRIVESDYYSVNGCAKTYGRTSVTYGR